MRQVLRIVCGIIPCAVLGLAVLWLYAIGTSYIFANGLADPEWGWPLAGASLLLFLLTHSFALNRILIRLDR